MSGELIGGQTFHQNPGVPAPRDAAAGWASRDLLILGLLASSTPQAEIAQRLSCSVSTIERRLGVLRGRLGVATTIEVVVAAVRAGVI